MTHFDMGYTAYWEDEECPYIAGTRSALEWLAGYLTAQEEDEIELDANDFDTIFDEDEDDV
jgi:hypothetical protein